MAKKLSINKKLNPIKLIIMAVMAIVLVLGVTLVKKIKRIEVKPLLILLGVQEF